MEVLEIKNIIGTGSFGEVYKCILESGDVCAVKIMSDGLSKDKSLKDNHLSSNLIELSIMATYSHPYLNTSYNINRRNSYIYIFQELALCDLFDYSNNYEINNSLLRRWTYQITQGIGCLHRENIIHCDIKPENIMIYRDGNIKLSDFGLSIYKYKENCTYSTITGTFIYMAPETWKQEKWDEKVDIWALGITLYQISTKNPITTIEKNNFSELMNMRIEFCKRIMSRTLFEQTDYNRDDLFINFVYSCLTIEKRDRINAEDLSVDKYISKFGNTTYYIDDSNIKISNLKDREKTLIRSLCIKYLKTYRVSSLLESLYSRLENLKMTSKIKIYSLIYIIKNICRMKLMRKIPIDSDKLDRNIKIIVNYLGYKLHINYSLYINSLYVDSFS